MRFVFSLFVLLSILSGPARAACVSPAGVAGTMDYFAAEKAYKYCNGTRWLPVGGADNTAGQSLRICTGNGPAGQWADYSGGGALGGVVMTINTAACGFTAAPQYFTNLSGGAVGGGHWRAIGSSAIYDATATNFTVYLYYADGSLNKTLANGSGWFIEWMAVGQ